MATISPNDYAPSESFKVILPTATFDLDPGGSYETEDRVAISDAEAHPWLQVKHPEEVELSVQRAEKSVPYADDYLSAPNSKAFDADEIRKIEEAKASDTGTPLAVEAGLDQDKSVTSGEGEHQIALTLEADDTTSTDDKPARKPRAAKGD